MTRTILFYKIVQFALNRIRRLAYKKLNELIRGTMLFGEKGKIILDMLQMISEMMVRVVAAL